MSLFGKRDEEGVPRAAAGPEEIGRLEALPLAELAAEVMARAFGPEGPGAPGRSGTIESPALSAPRLLLNEVAAAVTPAFNASKGADQIRVANLVAEGLQALELAALVRVTWRGGSEDFRATRRGRQAQERGEVEALVTAALG